MVATIQTLAALNRLSRNIFPFSMEGCRLYLPLWQEDMQGSTLLSYDEYHHSCTVTGAVWSATGRVFDGNAYLTFANILAINDHSAMIDVWLKRSGTGVYGICTRGNMTLGGRGSTHIYTSPTNVYAYIQSAGILLDWTYTLTQGAWYHLAFLVDHVNDQVTLVANGVAQATKANVMFTDNVRTEVFRLGVSSDALENALVGTIGEFSHTWGLKTVFNAQARYEATKWRYQ